MLQALRAFFVTPARQAAGWAAVGVLGILLATGGVYFLLEENGGNGNHPANPDPSVSATNTPSATGTPSPTVTPTRVGLTATAFARQEAGRTQTAAAAATATAQVTPSPTPVTLPTQPQFQPATSTPAPPTATPTEEPPTPTVTPTETSLVYCDATGGGATPPSVILGLVTIAGEPAPEGTIVTVAFNGVPSLSGTVTVGDGASGYRFLYGVGGGGCTNSAGAPISVIVNGEAFLAPALVGGELVLVFDIDAS